MIGRQQRPRLARMLLKQEQMATGRRRSQSRSGADLALILASMQRMRDGDFSVRLPGSWTGLPGKVADVFNEIVVANQQLSKELKTNRSGRRQRGQDP